jgi:hypothetical protein
LGPFIAAGPIIAALSGAAAGAALGGPDGGAHWVGHSAEYEAKRYEGKIKEGNILISVHAEESTMRDRAKAIFERAGAEDISYTEEKGVTEEARVVSTLSYIGEHAASGGKRGTTSCAPGNHLYSPPVLSFTTSLKEREGSLCVTQKKGQLGGVYSGCWESRSLEGARRRRKKFHMDEQKGKKSIGWLSLRSRF